MYPKRGGGSFRPGGMRPSPKGKASYEGSTNLSDEVIKGMENVRLDSELDDGWEVYARKSKTRGASNAPKPWGSRAWNPPEVQTQNAQKTVCSGASTRVAQCPVDSRRPAGKEVLPTQASNKSGGVSTISPPLLHGWNWAARNPSSKDSLDSVSSPSANRGNMADDVDDEDDEIDELEDTDDELLSDEFDSDSSQKSHGTLKKNKWFKSFLDDLDGLSLEAINEPTRQWHCPACKGGPGAIDWYRGLQPLITHAKTKGSKRVQVHRVLATLLEEELRLRGTSVLPIGESFGKWKGLTETNVDKEIIWPPMVIIMNTFLEKDDNGKWTGMGNQELLVYFHQFAASKARHSYGPQGHRGMSVLIFESTAVGYLEAERLSKQFEEEGADRAAWMRGTRPLFSGGERRLYGYMAEKDDLDYFNQHSQGKSKLKYEFKSYQQMVVSQMKQMNEDNQQLIWYKDKVIAEQRHSQALKESFSVASEKLRRTLEENRLMKLRTKKQHEQNKEEMDSQEQFYKNQIELIHEARSAMEDCFDKRQQEEREKMQQSNTDTSSKEDHRLRAEEIVKFIDCQDKEMEDFVAEKDELLKIHEEKMAAMKQKHWEEEVALEKEFDARLNALMDKYTHQ